MIVLSQTQAQLDEQYPNQFAHVRVQASLLTAEIMFKRGETFAAFNSLTTQILPYALEHASKKFRVRVLSLLGKVTIKIAG